MEDLTEVQSKIYQIVMDQIADYFGNSKTTIIEEIEKLVEVDVEKSDEIEYILCEAQRDFENFGVVGDEGPTDEELTRMEEEIDKPAALEIAKLF
jgi:hypothetical protein